MTDIWFSSDLHFMHSNILKYDQRPFETIEEHDEALITYFNELVKPKDILFLLGDVCMGPIKDSLGKAKQLNGYRYLISGNHDRVSKVNKTSHRAKFREQYEDVFHILPDNMEMSVNGKKTNFSHYPYELDHTKEARYLEYRMTDDGTPIVHGHTHSKETISHSQRGTLQVHIGVTSHNYRPVHSDELAKYLEGDSD